MANSNPHQAYQSVYQPGNEQYRNGGNASNQSGVPTATSDVPVINGPEPQTGPTQQREYPRLNQYDQREFESYQGREACTKGSVNYTIPSQNHNIYAPKLSYEQVLNFSLSLSAFLWGWIGLLVIIGAVAMIVLAFLHSSSDYELSIGLMIAGVFCLLLGCMAFIKGTVTCFRNYKERTSPQSPSAPLLNS